MKSVNIDYGIKTFVRDLNNKGFKTVWSCAGHNEKDKKGNIIPGYISIEGKHSIDIVEQIAKRYVDDPFVRHWKGWRKGYYGKDKNKIWHTVIEFDAVGGKKIR